MNEIFQEFERTFDNGAVLLNGRPAWPAIRSQVFFAMRDNSHGGSGIQKTYSSHFKKIKDILYGFNNLFKRHPYLFFSNTNEHKLIEKKWTNKLFLYIYTALGKDNITYFERPVPEHCGYSENGNPSPVSATILQSFAVIISFFINPNIDDGNLKKILKEQYNISLDVRKTLRLLAAYEIVFSWFFKWKMPKAIFLSDSYALFHTGLISAAKAAKIPIIEHQHGIINFEHPAYNHYTPDRFDSWFYPDYLITFGPMALREIENTSFIDKDRIVPCGHPYLDFVYQQATAQTKQGHKSMTIGITLQWTDEDRVIPFINAVAKRAPEISFILIPRIPSLPKYKNLDLASNVTIEKKKDFYSLLKEITIHCTTYSTCALESPYMGVPNILIDFDKMATRYLSKVLPPSPNVFYVNDEQEFLDAANALKNYSPTSVKGEALHLYSFNYASNLDNFLKNTLLR